MKSYNHGIIVIIWILGSICVAATAQSLRQGIKGQVFLVGASPDSSSHANPEAGVQREIHIYELTTLDQATPENGIFKTLPTNKVASVLSKADGSFKVKLLPGAYSVFVQEANGLFANLFEKNQINPVVVKAKQYSWISITIDYPGL